MTPTRSTPSVPASRLVAPAVVLDFSAAATADADFLLGPRTSSVESSSTDHCRPAAGCSTAPVGMPVRATRRIPERRRRRAVHTGHLGRVRSMIAEESPVIGVGTGTVGTDAGAAHSFDPAFPCHSYLMGNGKYGLIQLQGLAQLPPTGAVLIAGPLPVVSGSGSPARVLALVER
jgi:kynurenine formamidase